MYIRHSGQYKVAPCAAAFKYMNINLRVAEEADLNQILAYARIYHEFEGVIQSDVSTETALRPLLGQNALGRLWLICLGSQPIGYIVICYGYSIEFAGRDALVDEMFITNEHRGNGFGKAALSLVKSEAAALGIRVLHLEVGRTNERAQRLYHSAGFVQRERFFLMSATIEDTVAQQDAPEAARR